MPGARGIKRKRTRPWTPSSSATIGRGRTSPAGACPYVACRRKQRHDTESLTCARLAQKRAAMLPAPTIPQVICRIDIAAPSPRDAGGRRAPAFRAHCIPAPANASRRRDVLPAPCHIARDPRQECSALLPLLSPRALPREESPCRRLTETADRGQKR